MQTLFLEIEKHIFNKGMLAGVRFHGGRVKFDVVAPVGEAAVYGHTVAGRRRRPRYHAHLSPLLISP